MPHASSEFLNRHEIVRAGAGAGKTYTLTHKVMDIAADHHAREGKWPRLVVTTFTRSGRSASAGSKG
ncbi:MAG: UvrD-helicase domain-containing protein, partial [Bdellovibrionota bacterium]